MAHLFIVIQSVPYDEFIGDVESDPVCLIMFLPSFGQNLIKYNACSDGCGTAILAEFHCFGEGETGIQNVIDQQNMGILRHIFQWSADIDFTG